MVGEPVEPWLVSPSNHGSHIRIAKIEPILADLRQEPVKKPEAFI
jgi:hypothetical protein